MNANVANNSKMIQDFLWAIANRHAELKKESLEGIEALSDITDFSFYGDVVVFDSPNIMRGVFNTAKEFAQNNNCEFKAACANGHSWVLKVNSLTTDEELKEAYNENIKIGGNTVNNDAWKANRQYFKSL